MPDYDVAGIMPTVQKNSLAQQTQARAIKTSKIPAAIPPSGPTGFWNRITQVGVGKVNLANATKMVKSTAVSTAKGVEGAATGIARTLPGGQNDLKAAATQTASANNQTKNILQLQKSGKINKGQASKLLTNAASNASQGASSVTKIAKSEPTTKEFVGDLTQTALLAVPGAGEAKEAATGADLLKTFGTQGVKDLADKAGVDISGKGAIEGAKAVASTKLAQQAFKKAGSNIVERTAGSAAKGAAGFGTFSAAQEAGQGGSNKQILKAGVTGAAEGAVAGATGSLIKSGIKAKTDKTPTIEKGTAPRETSSSPVNTLGDKAKARTALLGQKAVTGRQATPEPSETKLLGPGTGKVTGKGFTASPTADVSKIKIAARLNTINKKLNDVAQGKTTMSAEDVKALKNEKAGIYQDNKPRGSNYTSGSQTTQKAFSKSSNQEDVATHKGVKFQIGDMGKNALSKKTLQNDRFDPKELPQTVKNIKASYRASDNPKSYRYDNIAHVAEMPNGEKRVIYTRRNAAGNEEIINAHSIQKTPNYESRLASYGNPARTRTGSFGLERRAESVPQGHTDNVAHNTSKVNRKDDGKSGGASNPPQASGTVTKGKTKLVKPPSGPTVSGSVLKSESRAVEKGLVKEFEDKAGYTPTSYKSDAESAVTLAHENPDKAMDIATGKKSGTSPSHEVAVRRAVETKALNEGDTETLQKLATSPLHSATSEAAQRLGAEAYNADDSSPVEAMRHVAAARTAAVEKKLGTSVPKAINDTAKEIASHEKAPSKFEWQSFIESIKC